MPHSVSPLNYTYRTSPILHTRTESLDQIDYPTIPLLLVVLGLFQLHLPPFINILPVFPIFPVLGPSLTIEHEMIPGFILLPVLTETRG